MSDQAFLQIIVERAQNVIKLQKMGNRFKAAVERNSIYRDIEFYGRENGAAIAMYEKIAMYYLEERPAASMTTSPRKNTKIQKRKVRR